ncbi:MAG: DUF6483 family protein [Clostridiaceae bacterium]|nr:DUF6483 family protein [Clostridiaceae bacterium]
MIEQDYIMRQIKEIVKMALKLFANKDTEMPSVEILQDEASQNVLDRLKRLIDEGRINEAENELFKIVGSKEYSYLKISMLFYSYLNEKDDEFLENNNFSREEVQKGLKDVMSKIGLKDLMKIML